MADSVYSSFGDTLGRVLSGRKSAEEEEEDRKKKAEAKANESMVTAVTDKAPPGAKLPEPAAPTLAERRAASLARQTGQEQRQTADLAGDLQNLGDPGTELSDDEVQAAMDRQQRPQGLAYGQADRGRGPGVSQQGRPTMLDLSRLRANPSGQVDNLGRPMGLNLLALSQRAPTASERLYMRDRMAEPAARGVLSDERAKEEAFRAGKASVEFPTQRITAPRPPIELPPVQVTGEAKMRPFAERAREHRVQTFADAAEENAQRRLMESLQAHDYRYKDNAPTPDAGKEFIGPMAQELQGAGPAGANMVQEGPDGLLRVDPDRAGLTSLGLIGDLHKRLRTVEKRQRPSGRRNAGR